MSEVKWISPNKVRWFVARHGSKFVYVELKATERRGEPLLVRSIRVIGKRGENEVIYSEYYTLDKAKEIIEAENALLKVLESLYSGKSRNKILMLKSAIFSIESNLKLIKSIVEDLEVEGGEKDA